MPVVTVRSLRPEAAGAVQHTLAGVVAGLSAAVGCEPADVWAHWVEMGAVAQGDAARGYEGHCPVVTVRARARSEEAVGRGLAAVALAVAEGLGVPVEDVWVHWEELPAGRVFAGARVR